MADTVGSAGFAPDYQSAPLDRLRARFPKEDLEYLRTLATTLLVLVVLPLAVLHLLLHPMEVADHAIKQRIPG